QVDKLQVAVQEFITQNQTLKSQNMGFKAQNQVIMGMIEQSDRRNDVQFRSTLKGLHATICSIIPVPKVPPEIATPLTQNYTAVRSEAESSRPPSQA
ncbi:hypothetical protein Csa_023963, partial [Cucumis sativus]